MSFVFLFNQLLKFHNFNQAIASSACVHFFVLFEKINLLVSMNEANKINYVCCNLLSYEQHLIIKVTYSKVLQQ